MMSEQPLMDAFVCSTLDSKNFADAVSKLNFSKISRPVLARREVRVKVISASINYFELLSFLGKYQLPLEPPFAAGTEGAGIIIEMGADADPGFALGDRVCWIGAANGSLADETVVDTNVLLKMPKNWSFDDAAGYAMGFCTGYHGLIQRGQLSASRDRVVLVTGAAGGMGLSAIQIAKYHYAEIIIAAVGSDEKKNACFAAGATHAINYNTEDFKARVQEFTNGHGIDVCYDVVGGEIFNKCARAMAAGGRLLVVGFTSGEIPKFPTNICLVKGFSVVGVRSGHEMMADDECSKEIRRAAIYWPDQQRSSLLPKIDTIFPRKNARLAFERLAARKAIGKLVIRWVDEASYFGDSQAKL